MSILKNNNSVPQSNINESAMGEIDIMAQESKTFKEFVKEFHKEFSLIELDRETIKWLEGIWKGNNRNESVSEESKTPAERIQTLNNRIAKLRGDMARTKSDNQKNIIQARLKNALQTLANIRKDLGTTGESVNEEEKSAEEIVQGLRQMALGDLERIEDYAEMIADRMEQGQELSSWMYSQITLAVDQLNSVHDSLDGKDGVKEESVNEVGSGDWHFKEIKKLWDKAGSFTRKKIAGLITKNPNSTWDKIEKVLRGSDYDDATYYTDMLHLESLKEAKTYKKGDKLKIKLPNGKKFDVVFDAYSKQKGVAFGKFKDGSGEYDVKPFNLDTIVESVNEAPAPKIKNTITKKEWSKIAKYNKHIGMDGTHYVMKYDDKIGTYLQAVKLVDEIKEGGCGCGCGCGGAKLESKDGLERVAQGLPQTEEEPINEWRAEEVLHQMGGRRFIAMTGAKNFVKNDPKKQITFKIGGGAKGGINYVRITLTSMDVYNMEFIKARGTDLKVVATEKGVYNDQLQQMFTKHTGMHTRL